MAEPVPLVEVHRGPLAESIHRGHAVVCGAGGDIIAAWGDPAAVILPRSSVKMIQALPLVESGAADDLPDEWLALACASHRGARIHVEAAAAWLASIGRTEADLRCGPQVPRDRVERATLRAAKSRARPLHNNCSGKHVGFLALARHLGAGPEYIEVDHPVQKAVRTAFEEMTGAESPLWGTDGCSAPNFATTVAGLGRAMAAMASSDSLGKTRAGAARRLVTAMVTHPHLVSGPGGACTELMMAADGRAAVKTGAEGVYTAILPQKGLGVAVKIEDGATRASTCAIVSLLTRLQVLDPDDPTTRRYLRPEIRDRRGAPAGEIRPAPELWADGTILA